MTEAPISGCFPPDSVTLPPVPSETSSGQQDYPAVVVGAGAAVGALSDYSDTSYLLLKSANMGFHTAVGAFYADFNVSGSPDDTLTWQIRFSLEDAAHCTSAMVTGFNLDTFDGFNWLLHDTEDLPRTEGLVQWETQPFPFGVSHHGRWRAFVRAFPTSDVGSTPIPLFNVYELQLCVTGVVVEPATATAPPLRQFPRPDSRVFPVPQTRQRSLRRGGPVIL